MELRGLGFDELYYNNQIYTRVHRDANVGDTIQVSHMLDDQEYIHDYKYGEIYSVVDVDDMGVEINKKWHDDETENIYLLHEEYDVIIPVP